MAIVSSHTLNSVDGTHAGGIAVALFRIAADGMREPVFQAVTDDGGRLLENVTEPDGEAAYELVLQTAAYFETRALPRSGTQILREVVIRFGMPDPDGRYHIPLILSPNGYSVWWSS